MVVTQFLTVTCDHLRDRNREAGIIPNVLATHLGRTVPVLREAYILCLEYSGCNCSWVLCMRVVAFILLLMFYGNGIVSHYVVWCYSFTFRVHLAIISILISATSVNDLLFSWSRYDRLAINRHWDLQGFEFYRPILHFVRHTFWWDMELTHFQFFNLWWLVHVPQW